MVFALSSQIESLTADSDFMQTLARQRTLSGKEVSGKSIPQFARFCAGLKELLGYDPEESFHVDEEALAHARKVAERGLEAHKEYP